MKRLLACFLSIVSAVSFLLFDGSYAQAGGGWSIVDSKELDGSSASVAVFIFRPVSLMEQSTPPSVIRPSRLGTAPLGVTLSANDLLTITALSSGKSESTGASITVISKGGGSASSDSGGGETATYSINPGGDNTNYNRNILST